MTKFTEHSIPDQTGRVFVITGANSGIGYEASVMLLNKGATVVVACRNQEKARTAIDNMVKSSSAAGAKDNVDYIQLDLANLQSVKAFSDAFHEKYDKLDVLINNAGVMALNERCETKDGYEMQMGTNHFGHFALTRLLFDRLASTPHARVVNVSSMAHAYVKTIDFDDIDSKKKYSKWTVYGWSKLSNVLFTKSLNEKAAAAGVDVTAVACHPGYSNTSLQDDTVFKRLNYFFAQSAKMGALPTLMAATLPDVVPGSFYGPNRLFSSRGYPEEVPRQLSSAAKDSELREKLWAFSEERVGKISELSRI